MEQEFIDGTRGFVSTGHAIATFEVQGIAEREDIHVKEYNDLYARFTTDRMSMQLDGFTVPFWGEGHNLYPHEVYSVLGDNKLLPGVIDKQVKFLFGKGPRLYQEIIDGEGKNQRRIRLPYEDNAINDWCESWELNGYDPLWIYLRNLIQDRYYVNTEVSKYHYNLSRRATNDVITSDEMPSFRQFFL
ncbi:MAG: hypothetical protein LBL90_13390 [Prevotellaceae bacterium]|jgi:hypothetical protein|nr:hypothetical protein [Prevotellaceae bacterium]